MPETSPLLARLQAQQNQLQRLLTPGLKPSPVGEPFAGRKFQLAARQMRVLDGGQLGLAKPQQIMRFGAGLVQRLQESRQLLHLNPKMTGGQTAWGGLERIFPGTVPAKTETPAAP